MQVRSLTRTEAEQRSALLEIRRYDVAVDLTALLTGPELRCVSTVTFGSREPGVATFIDCAAELVSATLNGEPVGGAAEEGRLRLEGLAAENTLVVETVQAQTATGQGVRKATDPADGEVYLWTSFEPDQARFVWACFDQPDLKAPHAFTVTAPAAWTVLSNSGDPEVQQDSDDTRRWAFPATPPLSTYNPVILAGPFVERRREAGGHDLGIFTRRSLEALLERDADDLFRVTEQGLAFFAEAFAMPFPQRKYDQVWLPEFGGAMENYGCVAWTDAWLWRSDPTPAERELTAKVLLHEMAHMWFGNIVTMRWWDDLWLNEAFAEFACNWAASQATEYVDAWASQLAQFKIGAYLADQGPSSHPIRQPVEDVAAAASNFDVITYRKGAPVLRQLMEFLGEDTFRAGMQGYFARHAWGNTSLDDLIASLAEASGRDLEDWRTGWLETAGTDRLSLEHGDDGWTLVGRGPAGPPRPQVLQVGAYRREGDRMVAAGTTRLAVTGPRTGVELPGADLHLVNDEDLTFATSRPSSEQRDVLLGAAGLLPTSLARGVAVATVWDMLTSGEASPAETVGTLCAVLRNETARSVTESYLGLASEAALLWSPPRLRPELRGQVAEVSRALAEDPDQRRVALRSLAATTADPDEVDRLRRDAGTDTDLQWRLLLKAAELGGYAAIETDVEALADRDPNPEAWTRALAVRAASPTVDDKEAAWQALAEERSVPYGAYAEVASAFWRPEQDELLRPFPERYLELLPELDDRGMIASMLYAGRLFPRWGFDADFLDRVVAASRTAAPVVTRSVVEKADWGRRLLRARNA